MDMCARLDKQHIDAAAVAARRLSSVDVDPLTLHFRSIPLPSFPLEVAPLNPSRRSGERCKLPQRGLGRSPSRNRIWCILALKYDICTNFNDFPETVPTREITTKIEKTFLVFSCVSVGLFLEWARRRSINSTHLNPGHCTQRQTIGDKARTRRTSLIRAHLASSCRVRLSTPSRGT